ncbi:MAG: lipid IV(A) 3-deoxy-D-manno-octulosonic acid transferase [Thiomicrospira sp.]|uniref:lipid IV(A) 3-deoxy-D-manno-octulosonic acid transferase n=1 Tax=Thiomicrospira sp. TaxID=935 RepID=UPI001A0C1010|nr:lipid IV(A) 3-deoxy-D-manno-octulosonic acid transferase [Thiomicrospira sp.]MBE0494579.1 lipid IV(A) 3-deoxy-D-manno-octulosonic acid transferase [Thiomicrospira sp.]
MTLWLYRTLLWLVFPFIVYSGWKRCRKSADPDTPIIDCFRARFGLKRAQYQTGGIWIHAVSVGETRSIFPLLKQLHQTYPNSALTVTNGSTQGALQALKFSPVPIQHQMIPYDYSFAVHRFLDQIQPKLVIMIETEIWPNLYQACHQRGIPLILANARLKQGSFESYQKWGGRLVKNALNQTHLIASQFDIDRQHFIQLGAEPARVKTLGNLKFDIEIPPGLVVEAQTWRQQHDLTNRFIWVAASTHAGEETLMLQAHQTLRQQHPDALLILVPRHADRFEAVANELKQHNINFAQRSQNQTIQPESSVYFADTIGELMLWFAVSDVAFIGGSLVPFGGHNILEPAALSKPVISGQYHQNLQALYDSFKQADGLMIAQDVEQLSQQLIELSQSTEQRQQAGERAKQGFSQQTGALQRLIEQLPI